MKQPYKQVFKRVSMFNEKDKRKRFSCYKRLLMKTRLRETTRDAHIIVLVKSFLSITVNACTFHWMLFTFFTCLNIQYNIKSLKVWPSNWIWQDCKTIRSVKSISSKMSNSVKIFSLLLYLISCIVLQLFGTWHKS